MGRGYKPLTSLAVITFNALVGCHVARPYLKTPRRPATFAALQLATMKLCCHRSSIAVFCLPCCLFDAFQWQISCFLCARRGPQKFRLLLFSVRSMQILKWYKTGPTTTMATPRGGRLATTMGELIKIIS